MVGQERGTSLSSRGLPSGLISPREVISWAFILSSSPRSFPLVLEGFLKDSEDLEENEGFEALEDLKDLDVLGVLEEFEELEISRELWGFWVDMITTFPVQLNQAGEPA